MCFSFAGLPDPLVSLFPRYDSGCETEELAWTPGGITPRRSSFTVKVEKADKKFVYMNESEAH